MCGRFANTENIAVQAATFKADPRDTKWEPSANCAPHQQLPIVFEHSQQRFIRLATWGIQASWSPGKALINAQSETAHEKVTFKDAFQQRRCIIPANAFYEWQKHDSGKQAKIIQCENQHLFPMAGIWELQQDGEQRIGRFTILTTSANQRMQDIHARMPVILQTDALDTWLNPSSSLDSIRDLCRPYHAEHTHVQDMDNSINNIRNHDTSLVASYLL